MQTYKGQRETIVPEIPDALLKRYTHIQSRQGVQAVGEVDDERCGACHVTLHSYLIKSLQEAKTIQTCDSCGRILIWVEGE